LVIEALHVSPASCTTAGAGRTGLAEAGAESAAESIKPATGIAATVVALSKRLFISDPIVGRSTSHQPYYESVTRVGFTRITWEGYYVRLFRHHQNALSPRDRDRDRGRSHDDLANAGADNEAERAWMRMKSAAGNKRVTDHAGRIRLPQIVVGFTRMKCGGIPSIHGSSPASKNGACSASVSR
jgi:hypothetical protein